MNVSDLADCLQQFTKKQDWGIVIEIKKSFTTVGGTPFVEVKSVKAGFDWDKGKIFLIPETPLTNEDVDFAKKFKELQDRAGWLEYENRGLKAEIKKLKKLAGVKDE